MNKNWYVYLLKCADDTLYCGITTNIDRRIDEHNRLKCGAKYTRSRRPVSLFGFKVAKSRSEALKMEHSIKKLSRQNKIELFINY